MDTSLETRILDAVRKPGAPSMKPKALARKLRVKEDKYDDFKKVLKRLIARGDIELDRSKAIRAGGGRSELVGVFKGLRSGGGIVRSTPGQGKAPVEVFIRPHFIKDAVTGDTVRVTVGRRPPSRDRMPAGRVIEIVERDSVEFVGTIEIKGVETFVRLDGPAIPEPIYIADASVKGARPGDKVVVEMLRFPSPMHFGEAVVIEVLGRAGEANVDLLAVIRQFKLPDEFPPEVMKEARQQAATFEKEVSWPSRTDLTGEAIITIDPVDAKDFDDAVSLTRTEEGHWRLGVHIADVAAFVPEGGDLDREAKKRGTSVYLPGKVLPMIPETISNGLASLQQDRKRLTKSVFVEIDRLGRIVSTQFANSVIKVAKRFTYGQVQQYFGEVDEAAADSETPPTPDFDKSLAELLLQMRELADLLRRRRRRKGMLEMAMPEAELEYDEDGHITGCHYHLQTESQRLIEEFMLTANEAVAEKLTDAGVLFLRRIHPHPDPLKLKAFAQFAKSLNLVIENEQSRFDLQKVLQDTLGDPRQPAVHYALLRSLKEATYGPAREGHFALASEHYCHFTSPIRRYPDLAVHRLLDALIRKGRASADETELIKLGEHCSLTERRAAKAERELVKVKLLEYMRERIGQTIPMIVTSVEEFGLFCQGEDVPADGLLHVRNLPQDFYTLDRTTLTLSGRKQGNQFRLGARLMCVIHRVDVAGRMLDLRLSSTPIADGQPRSSKSLLAAIPGAKPKRSSTPRLPKKGGKKPVKRKRRR